jgi:hypothetical protein
MNKCWYGVIIFWRCFAGLGSSWGLDSSCHLRNCDTNTLCSPIVWGSSIVLSISFSITELGLTTSNVSDGVYCLSFKNYVPRESEDFLNIDISVSFKTLILKIKHIYIYIYYFFLKTYNNFYIKNQKVSKFQQGLANMNLFMNVYYFL